jgi:hypothetical protein
VSTGQFFASNASPERSIDKSMLSGMAAIGLTVALQL